MYDKGSSKLPRCTLCRRRYVCKQCKWYFAPEHSVCGLISSLCAAILLNMPRAMSTSLRRCPFQWLPRLGGAPQLNSMATCGLALTCIVGQGHPCRCARVQGLYMAWCSHYSMLALDRWLLQSCTHVSLPVSQYGHLAKSSDQ